MSEEQPASSPAEEKKEPQQAVPEPNGKKTNNSKKHRVLFWLTVSLLVIALAWFLLWLFYLRYHEFTDDAFANGSLVNINSAVSGSAIAFYADDTDLVLEGQLLVSLDPTEYQIAYERELASLASTVLQVRQLYDAVSTNQANFDSKRIAYGRARYDYDNRAKLVDSLAISKEDYVHAQDTLTIAEFDMKQAEYQLQTAISAAGNTPLIEHPLIQQQKARVREAYYNLKHCSIYAPTTGYVAQRSVNVGEWVPQNRALMAVIPIDYVWVDANYKETQLTWMRVGQPATVHFDLYGRHVVYQGKVLGIASGSGSVFSLIPPQNATGNWIKIVQRLPVRISLDPETVKKFPVRLGISAEVSVDLTNQDLPMLVEAPNKRPIATTQVFDIDLTPVNELIDQIIEENLRKQDLAQAPLSCHHEATRP